MMSKPKIFIASPLFNAPQIAIIRQIEEELSRRHFLFYSARLHSGSDLLSPEDRKDIHKWDPVFQSNEDGLNECRVCIAVLEYALPEDHKMLVGPYHEGCSQDPGPCFAMNEVELPDAGTVWETGYLRAQGKPVIGFHSQKRASHLNLMLSHGCDGLISGWDNLRRFLAGTEEGQHVFPPSVHSRIGKVTSLNAAYPLDIKHFDWTATEEWDAATAEVE